MKATNKRVGKSYFNLLFVILVAFDLVVTILNWSSLRIVSKPLILLSLLLYFGIVGRKLEKRMYRFMLLALFFSWIGDLLLLFEDPSGTYFILGLLSFLLAHFCYLLVFIRKWNATPPPNFRTVIIALFIYGGTLLYILKDGIGTLLFPVTLYVMAILFMATTAYRRYGSVGSGSFRLVFFGALFFIASDSVLAFEKFMMPVPWAPVFVMATYAAAQYMIVDGILLVAHTPR